MALVLSRRAQEQIRIGEHIVITVTKVAGNRTSIAIEAPKEVRVLRGELIEPKENAA